MAGLGEAPKVLEIQLSIVGVQTADYTEKYSVSAFYSMELITHFRALLACCSGIAAT
jgi:hypothetical protein